PPRDVDRYDRAARSSELSLERAAVRAERVRKLDDDLAGGGRRSKLDEVDGIDAPRPHAAKPCREAVDLAADAKSGDRREEREPGDEETEDKTDRVQADEVRDGGGTEKDRADDVRESRWAAIFDPSLADKRLDDLEVQKTRKAITTAENEADRELARKHPEYRPPVGDQRAERKGPDDRMM